MLLAVKLKVGRLRVTKGSLSCMCNRFTLHPDSAVSDISSNLFKVFILII